MQLNRSSQLRAKEREESGTSIPSHSRRAIAVLILIPIYSGFSPIPIPISVTVLFRPILNRTDEQNENNASFAKSDFQYITTAAVST